MDGRCRLRVVGIQTRPAARSLFACGTPVLGAAGARQLLGWRTTLSRMGEVGDRIESALVGGIESGAFRAGDKLPSERALAAEHGASRTTVRLVLVKLAALGLVEPQHGRGYFVRPRSGRARRSSSAAKASGR
jgi:hypothetical protein